jgi:GntR family transcriptional regulator
MNDFTYHPFPKYLQIREIVGRRLRSFEPGDRLPTEAELSNEFGVSRVTVRQVMQSFATEGIIERRPRVGTILRVRPPAPVDNRLTGPIEGFGLAGLETQIAYLKKTKSVAADDVAAALRLKTGTKIYEIQRLRIFADEPLLLLEAFFPLKIGRAVARQNVSGLFVPELRKLIDRDIWEGDQQIDALVAGPILAKVLSIAEDVPVLSVKRLFLDSKGEPVVFFKENFRADRYFYTVRLPRPSLPLSK